MGVISVQKSAEGEFAGMGHVVTGVGVTAGTESRVGSLHCTKTLTK